jgi:hypothetical protein
MKKLAGTLTLILAAAVVAVGCSSASKAAAVDGSGSGAGAAAAASGKAGPATYVSGTPLSDQTTTSMINDPSLNNITAATLTIPAGWKLEGIEMMSACTYVPWPVYRAYSADGLMQMRSEPVFGWKWSPNMRGVNTSGCANISKPISAADFLQYYLGTMTGGVHVMGTMPVAGQLSQWAQGLAANANAQNSHLMGPVQANNTADTAAMRIEVVNGSFVVEERLRDVVECTIRNSGPLAGGTCWARVDVLTAPQGQLDALVKVVDGENLPHGVNTQQWMQAALARQQREGQQQMAALTAMEKRENQMLYQQFQQIMARSQQEHQQFMQQQESQFQSAMAGANASMNAQTTSASDWVDYALDQQTVQNPNGTITKVSSAYSQTWTNGTQWYQTDDTNVNPNGYLKGNWTQTTKVHGNGQPIQ